MTTLDGVERSFDAESVLVCDRNGPSGIAGIMGGQVSEVSDATTRVLLEVATWNGVNILRTSRKLGLRSEASNRFEKQLHPELAMRAQRIASRLIVEVCGARLVPGTIDVAAEIPAPHASPAGRGPRRGGCSAWRSSPTSRATYLERLGFDVERDGDDLDATVPPHRHYDVSREVDLVEEVGADPRLRRAPAGDPAAARPGRRGGLTRDQALRRRAEDVMRDLGFDAVTTLSLTDPGMPDRLRLGGDDPRAGARSRVSNPLSVEHSELRTTLLGSLLDAARYNLAHGAERVALFESGRAYLRRAAARRGRGRSAATSPASAPRRRMSRTGSRALAVGPLVPPSWRDPAARRGRGRTSSRSRACSRRSRGQLGVEARGRARPRAVPAARPRRRRARRRRRAPAGSASFTRSSAPRLGPRGGDRRSSSTSPPLVAASRYGRESYEDVISFPAVHEDIAVVVADDVSAEAVSRRGARGGRRPAARRPRSSTSTAASRSARAARASRCGSSSAPPTARSPTRRSPSAAPRSPGAGEDRRVAA